jgi:phospholipid N-methyltransferase
MFSSLKQQFTGRHVNPLWHIILISGNSVFALTPSCYKFNREAANINVIVSCLNLQSSPLKVRMIIITASMMIYYIVYPMLLKHCVNRQNYSNNTVQMTYRTEAELFVWRLLGGWFTWYCSETCLNRTLNKPGSCVNQTLNKVPM